MVTERQHHPKDQALNQEAVGPQADFYGSVGNLRKRTAQNRHIGPSRTESGMNPFIDWQLVFDKDAKTTVGME